MDAAFILRRIQKGEGLKIVHMFYGFRELMQQAQRKKELPEILVKAVMSLYEGLKAKVKVKSKFPEEFL